MNPRRVGLVLVQLPVHSNNLSIKESFAWATNQVYK